MNGFEKRTQQKKRKILNTAFDLFAKHGVQKVSIQEIAKKAQVSQVTIYNYFGSKDQMLIESIKDYYQRQIGIFQEVVEDPNRDFKEKMESFITLKSQNALNLNPEIMQSFVADNPDLQAFIQEMIEQHSMPLMMRFIEEGKEQGYVHENISTDILMFYMNMFYEAIQKRKDLLQTQEAIQKFTNEVLHLFFYGIMGK